MSRFNVFVLISLAAIVFGLIGGASWWAQSVVDDVAADPLPWTKDFATWIAALSLVSFGLMRGRLRFWFMLAWFGAAFYSLFLPPMFLPIVEDPATPEAARRLFNDIVWAMPVQLSMDEASRVFGHMFGAYMIGGWLGLTARSVVLDDGRGGIDDVSRFAATPPGR
jgi:hypothetical protein